MNDSTTPIEALFEKAENYSKTTLELLKLTTIDKTADVVSTLSNQLTLIILATMFTLMVNIALALWIGQYLGGMFYGFFVMGGVYLIATSMIYAFGNDWIKKPVNNSMINLMLRLK